MKTIIFLALIGVVWSRPQFNPAQAVITKFENTINEIGSYFYSFETSDGQKQEQRGEIKNPGTDQESLAVVGEYSYIGDDGKMHQVSYTADENGYRPKVGLPSAAVSSLAGGGLG